MSFTDILARKLARDVKELQNTGVDLTARELINNLGVNPSQYSGTDEQKLQSAINAAVSNKCKCIINKTYTITTTINVPSNCYIEFQEGGKITTNANISIFSHISDTDNANITIKNGNFEGSSVGTNQFALYFNNVKNLVIEYCTFKYIGKGCIIVENCDDFLIQYNYCSNNTFTGTAGDCANIIINGNTGKILYNTIYDSLGYGISCAAEKNVDIIGNKVWRCAKCGIVAAGLAHSQMIISKNNCCYNGTIVTAGAEGGINTHGLINGVISENICCYNKNYGIDINGDSTEPALNKSRGLLVTQNIVTNNDSVGIIAYMCKNTTISNNVCRTNYENITVTGADSAYVDVINNKCYDITGGYGNIFISAGNYILVEGNVCGEIFSESTTTFALYVTAAVTNFTLGYNDFSQAKKNRCITILGGAANVLKFKSSKLFISDEITLSGSAVTALIPIPYSATEYSNLLRAKIIYTEATNADAGVVCGIGSFNQGNTVFASKTTTPNAARGTIENMTLVRGKFSTPEAYDKPLFYCAGSKIGTGKVRLMVEYIPERIEM